MENFIFCAVLGLTSFAEKMKKDVTAHQHDQSIDIRQKSGRITCQFRGDGTYTVSWNRVNNTKLREGIIENKTTLIFNDVQFNDTGTYKCTAVGPKNTANAEIDLEVYGKSFYYSGYFCYNYLFIDMNQFKSFNNLCLLFNQKQPSRGVLIKRCSENMQYIYKRTPMLKCDFNKVALQLY